MPQKKGSSQAIIVLLITAIFSIFVLQAAMQEKETGTEIPRGADLAVIGGTTAALLSALEGAAHGAQVFLFPNGQEMGEDVPFLVAGGLAAALTPPQKELGIEFGPEFLKEKIKEHGGGINDPVLLDSFILSQDLFRKSEELSGLCFDLLPHPEVRPYLHLSAHPHSDLLFKQNLLVKIKNSTIMVKDDKVKELIFSPEGQIEALLLENARGESYRFYIQAVILADGGYSGDIHRWHEYLPVENLIELRPSQKGEGLRIAVDLGMDVVQMGFLNTRLLLYSPLEEKFHFLPPDPWENTYFINKTGHILSWGESSPREAINFLLQSLPGGSLIMAPEDRATAFGRFFRRFDELEQLMQAYSLDSLPRFPGTRPPSPPYYVAPLRAGLDYTLGGISITSRGEVKKDGNVVKGLYAAGEIVGGLHGEALLPGMALSETFFLAKIAGESAARYSQR
ncbi:MAG: FAD-binding protein [Dethiobacter sp.]|jgi:fumarate reductase flavoprotein subunit|nr:MAG: FAD-binding protein [Dethiobacter sp.]